MNLPAALTIAGSDPSGGAGIQADLKTFHQCRVYGEAVITLLTVQNTTRVSRVMCLPPDLVVEQIEAVVSDIVPRAAKTGALGDAGIIRAVAAAAADFRFPLVIDPVMISKHGASLLSAEASAVLVSELLPHGFLVTPNLPEAEALTGLSVTDRTSMIAAARLIASRGPQAVLMKGGHLPGEAEDLLYIGDTEHWFSGTRYDTPHTHGTGCTYSAAICAYLAHGSDLVEAVGLAKRFIDEAIRTNPGLGNGSGPVNHWASAFPDEQV